MNGKLDLKARVGFSPSRIDFFYTVGDEDILQLLTAGKGFSFDFCSPVRNCHARQCTAVVKHFLFDAGQALGQNDMGKHPAVIKSAASDLRHALGQTNFRETAAALKRALFSMLVTCSGIVTLSFTAGQRISLSPTLLYSTPSTER